MPFTTNMSGTVQFDDSIKLAFDKNFLLTSTQNNVVDQFAQMKVSLDAKSIQLTKYANLALATTPLGEYDSAVSQAMSDTPVILTPKEYGAVVTTTKLASLQSGGQIDLAASATVGINHGTTTDKLGIMALDASTNVITANGGAASTLTATDVMSDSVMNTVYNKLARTNITTFGGSYVMVAHDDVIADLRESNAVGSWVDVNKYASPESILRNEVGMYKGFRVVRDNWSTITTDGGSGTVDVYNSYFLGNNALGKAISAPASVIVSPANDPHKRFVWVAWYEVSAYGIVDQDAVYVAQTASSKGANQ